LASQALRTSLDLVTATTQQATSRSLPETMVRQRRLAHALLRNAPSARHGAASDAAARLAHRALAPVHGKATANAKRLTKTAR
jgi:hypothetical protein